MYGWIGKILTIDLTHETWDTLTPDRSLYEKFIGGRGLAGYYLSEQVTLPWNDPAMPLIFMTGPLVGTPSPTSGRSTVMSLSPLTGTIADTSMGGKFGWQMKRAGWDGIIITGTARRALGIEINDNHITFTPAEHLTGATVPERFALINAKGSTALTGPAAEQGVLFSGICADGHFFSGRNGLGLVMAAKKCRYITIQGSKKVPIRNMDQLKKAVEDVNRLINASPVLKGKLGIGEYGTGAIFDLINSRRMMPTDNFKKTWFHAAASVNGPAYKERYGTKKKACAGCAIQCKKIAHDNRAIPEYETMAHFTALIGNDDMEIAMEANRICNDAGMDTISAAVTLACYHEVTGEALTPETLLELLQETAGGRSRGGILKLGAARLAEHFGQPEAAMTVKSMELPAYDPRGAYGMALAYATSNRGGCHLRAYPISHEIIRKPVATDRFTFDGKARIIKLNEDANAVIDSLTACKFVFFGASLEEYAAVYTAVTGITVTAQELLAAGERIYYHERMMNARLGFSRKDDRLPERFFTGQGTGGEGIDVPPLDRKTFEATLDTYYRVRGLDNEGLPVKEKAEELGLPWNIS